MYKYDFQRIWEVLNRKTVMFFDRKFIQPHNFLFANGLKTDALTSSFPNEQNVDFQVFGRFEIYILSLIIIRVPDSETFSGIFYDSNNWIELYV